jgi:hypothetical protein
VKSTLARIATTLATGSLPVALFACSDPVAGFLSPTQLEAVSGSGQVGATGTPFPMPLVVEVRANDSLIIVGSRVDFRVSAGSAKLSASTVHTDATGRASVTVTPTAPGTIEVSATVFSSSLTVEYLLSASGAPSSPCATGATSLAVAQVRVPIGGDGLCIQGGAADADYVLMAFNADTAAAGSTTVRLTGNGLATTAGGGGAVAPTSANDIPSSPSSRSHARLLSSALAAPPRDTVGQRRVINANLVDSCTNPQTRVGRVVRVSSLSTIIVDSLVPSGALADAHYEYLAAVFDTLVDPSITLNVLTSFDMDATGRVTLFITPAVNTMPASPGLPPANVVFRRRDVLLPLPNGLTGVFCATSNAAEIFYLAVPDSAGAFGAPRQLQQLVTRDWLRGIAHEHMRLVNATRRLYIAATTDPETAWLDEGLGQIGEELLFYRMGARDSRQNLGRIDLTLNAEGEEAVATAQQANFDNYRAYLTNSNQVSPLAAHASAAARGAAWSLLRYLVDRRGGIDYEAWTRIVNSPHTGLRNLQHVFGPDALGQIRDWAISTFTDDLFATSPRYEQLSWNWRSIYQGTIGSAYPLRTVPVTSSATVDETIAPLTATWFRFTVPAGAPASVAWASNVPGPISPLVRFALVRTR